MNAIKSIFSCLGRFLEKARTVMLNLGTAFVLIFFTILIVGALTSSGPKVKDPSGRILFIDPQGTVVDQEVLAQISSLILIQALRVSKFKQEIS